MIRTVIQTHADQDKLNVATEGLSLSSELRQADFEPSITLSIVDWSTTVLSLLAQK